ncbi:glycosyltransferase family 2 protein [uncultured Methanobrevibacter sp.]|uniref:glycosyltransferase family 2 protein n=1 Tax=uncultured Methanobrevibacter sp. TaxID=253161 RepID=UPI0025F8FEB8|nr:glycosyltransferase family 2 protein [uncultured Methanobrevibacter sp.]
MFKKLKVGLGISMVAVSIIMPVYNSSNFLNKSIESIQKQTLKDIEIICVDDGSTDDSIDVLNDLNKKYGNIKIICQENSGPGMARNMGIKNAQGEYIAFLDSDDIFLDADALETMYNLGKVKDFNLVCANLKWINQDYTIDTHYDFLNSRFKYFYKKEIFKSEEYGIPFAFYRNLFKRSFLEENNIIFPDLRFGEDPVFMVNVLVNLNEFFATSLDLYGYNHSMGGGVNEKINNYEKKFAYLKHFKDIFDILKMHNFNSIFSIYKIEFIDYLVYSNNIHDKEIKKIIKNLFENYKDYFDEEEYGFFIMDYLIKY